MCFQTQKEHVVEDSLRLTVYSDEIGEIWLFSLR